MEEAAAKFSERRQRKTKKRKLEPEQIERLNSLPWNQALPQDEHDDPFSMLIGSNEIEGGGFLSLEEIDEAEYGLDIPEPEHDHAKKKHKAKQDTNLKKQKQDGVDSASSDVKGEKVEDEGMESNMKKKKKKKKKNKADRENLKVEQLDTGLDTNVKDDIGEEEVDETEFYAWNELRLHPLLMKAMYKLGFKEPTPIQKACIPAAAHQGKDVIGAAETGSGKTLAFGLPILQRLLEERDKAAKLFEQKGEEPEKHAPTGLLRALIIAPTRELALQTIFN